MSFNFLLLLKKVTINKERRCVPAGVIRFRAKRLISNANEVCSMTEVFSVAEIIRTNGL